MKTEKIYIQTGDHLKRDINIGIEILRIYLSFTVVNTHCYIIPNNLNYIFSIFLINSLHVPTFFIISFYFLYPTLFSKNVNKFKRRFQRLLIPYLVWPAIIWIINNLFTHFLKIELKKSFQDLIQQILTGHCFIESFWFQWNLIFVTFLFIIIELLFHENIIFILINLELFAYFFQYSQYNYKLFSLLNYETKYTFGRFVEILPFTISGFFFGYFKLIEILKKKRIKTIYICLIIFLLLFKYNFYIDTMGFGYSGSGLNILSLCLFITFSLVPAVILSNNIKKIILKISKITPGIYYIHIPILIYTQNFITFIKNKTLCGSIFIYIISNIFCYIGNKILGKNILKSLFQ